MLPSPAPNYSVENEAQARRTIDQQFTRTAFIDKPNTFRGRQNGPFFDSGGAVFNVKAEPYSAVGNGTTDDKAAIEAAINAAIAAGGGRVVFPDGTYRVNGKITVSDSAGYIIHLDGHGAGATSKPMIQFDGNDAGFYWAASGDEVRFSNLIISHTLPSGFDINTPATQVDLADYGVGIKMATANYVTFENVWVEYFNTGVEFVGFSFYSTFRQLRCHYNYTTGMKVSTGAILNGDGFYDCQFSNTLNGDGVLADFSGATAITFRNTYFEHNESEGMRVTNYLNLTLDGCYFEQNKSYDIISENINPHQPCLLHMVGSYIDQASRNSAGEPRIYLEATRFCFVNSRIYSTDADGSVPVFIARGGETAQPSMAFNCQYDSPTLTNIPNDQGIYIVDSKHPQTGFAVNQPTYGTSFKAGSVFYNVDETDTATVIGWRCVTSGAGAAQGPNGDAWTGTTASTTNGSKTVTLNNVNHPAMVGDFIVISGVTFGTGVSYARVEEVLSGPTLILDRNALATVAGAAITYRVATWQELTIDGSGFVKAA